MRSLRIVFILSLIVLNSCGLASHTVKSKKSFHLRKSPDSVMVKYLLLINEGKYEESLALFAFDVLKRDNITLDYYSKYCDKNISRQKSIESIKVIKIEELKEGTKVIFTITYEDGFIRTTNMTVVYVDGKWKITPVSRFS